MQRWLIVVCALWTAWSAVPAAEAAPETGRRPAAPAWAPLFRGIDHARAAVKDPVPLVVNAVRIDLRDTAIGFLVTPSNGERPLDTDGLKTSTFLARHKCRLAINASPYSPLVKDEGTPVDVLGLSKSCGEEYSPANPSYGVLMIFADNKARVAAPPIDAGGACHAVGGFRLLLRDGANVAEESPRHPRSAAGVSEDGVYLYLMAIDGRQPGYSEGATTAETAEWMRWAGAHDALNLDGGGSTALVRAGPDGEPMLMNRPIHAGIPGNERVNANHLGVFAEALTTAGGK